MFGIGKKHTVVLNVSGMHCPKCQKKVSDALNAVKGASASVELESGKATVVCPESVSGDMLCDAVKAVGFGAVVVL